MKDRFTLYLMVKIRSCQEQFIVYYEYHCRYLRCSYSRNCCWHSSSNTEYWSTSRHVVFHMVLLFRNWQRFFSNVSTSPSKSFRFLRNSVFFERICTARSSKWQILNGNQIIRSFLSTYIHSTANRFDEPSKKNKIEFYMRIFCWSYAERLFGLAFDSSTQLISWYFIPCICYRFSMPMEKSMESLFFFLREYQHQI